jgi:hypothetical protein
MKSSVQFVGRDSLITTVYTGAARVTKQSKFIRRVEIEIADERQFQVQADDQFALSAI